MVSWRWSECFDLRPREHTRADSSSNNEGRTHEKCITRYLTPIPPTPSTGPVRPGRTQMRPWKHLDPTAFPLNWNAFAHIAHICHRFNIAEICISRIMLHYYYFHHFGWYEGNIIPHYRLIAHPHLNIIDSVTFFLRFASRAMHILILHPGNTWLGIGKPTLGLLLNSPKTGEIENEGRARACQ